MATFGRSAFALEQPSIKRKKRHLLAALVSMIRTEEFFFFR
jgi:hypothetical protein